jgi:RNA polymerase sigma-70 factor (ECF subfamily)
MREVMQLKFKEIAEVIGVSENTIKSRMRYALENLRLALADYAPTADAEAEAQSTGSRK